MYKTKENIEKREQNKIAILICCIVLPVCFFGFNFKHLGIQNLPTDYLWCPILISLIMSFFFAGIFGKELNEKVPIVLKKYENEINAHNVSNDLVKTCETTVLQKNTTFVLWILFWGYFISFISCIAFFIVDFTNNGKSNLFEAYLSFSTWFALYNFIVIFLLRDTESYIQHFLDKFTCPFCNAPMSYFQTGYYEDGEYYFRKTVKHSKYIDGKTVNWTTEEPYVACTTHTISKCFTCGQEHDEIGKKERRT